MDVNRDRLRAFGLAVLVIVTVAAAASTAQQYAVPGSGDGQTTGGTPLTPPSTQPLPVEIADSLLDEVLQFLFSVFMIVGLCVLAFVVYRDGWQPLAQVIAIGITVGIIGFLITQLSAPTPPPQSQPPAAPSSPSSGGAGGSGGGVTGPAFASDFVLLAGLVFVGLVVGAIALRYGTARLSPRGRSVGPSGQSSSSGGHAGATDEPIPSDFDPASPPENEVFAAWESMASQLDLPMETTTPRECAAAATEAGMDPEAVATVTALFEETRYGTVDPTAKREQQARRAKRQLTRDTEDA